MAVPIKIGTDSHVEVLRDRLAYELKLLQIEGLRVEIDETESGEYTFLGCNITDFGAWSYPEEDINKIFKHYVANVLSDMIVDKWEKDLLEEIIRENYYFFSLEERQAIYKNAFSALNKGFTAPEAQFYQLSRKSRVLQKILDYLQNNDQILIDGFIKFRLRDYLADLEGAVESSVDQFLMEREHQEFIRLLKYFVEIQEPKIDSVHITVQANEFQILDNDKQNLVEGMLKDLLPDLEEISVKHEDLLVSALITLAPEKIKLHFTESKKFKPTQDTLYAVFEDRVSNCKGCDLCNLKH